MNTTEIIIVQPSTLTGVHLVRPHIQYGFKLTFPAVFTLSNLMKLTNFQIKEITIRKRVESAVKTGLLREIGKYRDKMACGRPRTVYCRANVTNIKRAARKSKLTDGELVLT